MYASLSMACWVCSVWIICLFFLFRFLRLRALVSVWSRAIGAGGVIAPTPPDFGRNRSKAVPFKKNSTSARPDPQIFRPSYGHKKQSEVGKFVYFLRWRWHEGQGHGIGGASCIFSIICIGSSKKVCQHIFYIRWILILTWFGEGKQNAINRFKSDLPNTLGFSNASLVEHTLGDG